MSQQFDNNLRGALFKNDKKTTDAHPLYRGNCEINGEEFWISAWLKEGKSGKFMSLSFQAKDDSKAPAKKSNSRDQDEDLPPF